MMPAISSRQAVWVLTRLRLRRLLNQFTGNLFQAIGKRAKARSSANPRKTTLWVIAMLMLLLMSFSLTFGARNILLRLECKLDAVAVCTEAGPHGKPAFNSELAADILHQAPFTPTVTGALALLLAIVFVLSVLMPLASRELSQPDNDLEWLTTLPVQRRAILLGRTLGRAASNGVGMLMLLPLLGMIAWYSNLGWYSVPAMLLTATVMLILAGTLLAVVDTGLRLWLSGGQLRNLQAINSLCSMPLMYFVMSMGMPQGPAFAFEWVAAYPAWIVWTPPGLLIRLMQARDAMHAVGMAGLLLLQSALLVWAGLGLLQFQLRHGVSSGGGREAVRRRAASAARADAAGSATLPGGSWLSPVQRRELRLLSRDRNFLVQTLLLPVVIVGSQMMFNGTLSSIEQIGDNPVTLSVMAFILGAYVLMLSAFQNLANEGQALWLLYTFPRPLESVLREKARLWGALALIYPAGVFALGFHFGATMHPHLLVMMLIVLAGMPLFSMIAVALGVFGCDPQATEQNKRMRPSYVYLYMSLCGFYGYAIQSRIWSQQLVVLVLMAGLALALWQKSRDALPYLLDPTVRPPARVSTADGLIAATLFFILQAIGVALFSNPRAPSLAVLVSAFAVAGVVVFALTRLIYWRTRTQGVPAILGGVAPAQALRLAAGLALPAVLGAIAYLLVLRHANLWPEALMQAVPAPANRIWLLLLAVGAAPLCEEFIFRGLIYGGLRRSMGVLPALCVSAALFAIMHPPVSMLPVFGLGLATAYAFERSKSLLAPMLVHAFYNAAVLGWQWYLA